ncbi:MAG: class I SAM-dependent methyltransferase, partial [Casimicrobiaceae bacterium]
MDPETNNAALAARYDAIAYAALPHPLTHPDRLATIATFLGIAAPAVATCRVLEVGCNDGSNLIPMAVGLPAAQFTGCDLSPRALDAGRRLVAELGLANVTLVEEDLTSLAPAHGNFDFIIAHGVYSWVPAHVRDGLFALAAQRLAPNGVMFVSFNALPGSRVRQAAWEMLHFHVDRIADPRARLDAVRRFARMLATGSENAHASDEALRAELRAIAQRSDSELYHDDLAVPNDPVYISDFIAHAGRFGLRYLAEAELHTMSGAGISAEAKAFLSAQTAAEREQYLDFVRIRRFRQSLLVRHDAARDPASHPARVSAMHVAADPSLLRAAAEGKVAQIARDLDPAAGGGGPVRKMLEALIAQSPATLPLADLQAQMGAQGQGRPLTATLTDAFVSGIVTLHVHPPRPAHEAGPNPEASPLARHEARTRDAVTTLLHTRVALPDANARQLLALLDGTRDRAALAAAMAGPALR